MEMSRNKFHSNFYRFDFNDDDEIFEDQGLLSAVDDLNREKSWGIIAPDSTEKL